MASEISLLVSGLKQSVGLQALTQALGKLRSKMTNQEKENGGKGEDILVSSLCYHKADLPVTAELIDWLALFVQDSLQVRHSMPRLLHKFLAVFVACLDLGY